MILDIGSLSREGPHDPRLQLQALGRKGQSQKDEEQEIRHAEEDRRRQVLGRGDECEDQENAEDD